MTPQFQRIVEALHGKRVYKRKRDWKTLRRLLHQFVAYVDRRDYVSFVEARTWLTGKIEVDGKEVLLIGSKAMNVVVCFGLSEEASDFFVRVLSSKRVHLWPCSTLVYFIDGAIPMIPLAKRIPKTGYKNPHWLPVTFRTKPPK